MLFDYAQRLCNEQSKVVLEDAVACWERVYEGVKLAEILVIDRDQLSCRITKLLTFGLSGFSDLQQTLVSGLLAKIGDM